MRRPFANCTPGRGVVQKNEQRNSGEKTKKNVRKVVRCWKENFSAEFFNYLQMHFFFVKTTYFDAQVSPNR